MIIYAPNIHQGGGKVLLEEILTSLKGANILISDSRLTIDKPVNTGIERISIQPSIWGRVAAEFVLRNRAVSGARVLCFGNLPPVWPQNVKVDLFFQNTILLKKYSGFEFSFPVRLKHFVERLWLLLGMRQVRRVFVQSEVVRAEFLKEFPNASVRVVPFVGHVPKGARADLPEFDFVYVASGDPHKNHDVLLRAWEILKIKGVSPSLALTISKNSLGLLARISELQKQGVKIVNFPLLSHSEVMDLYSRSGALVFPSLTESFGLPLLEAQAVGLPIVAAELDYVREVVSPKETFDPSSALSLSRAVMRFLALPEAHVRTKIYSATEFLKQLDS